MFPGSAKRLHRSRPSCQLIQGVINTNPPRGPASPREALSPFNQSCLELGLPALSAPAPGRGCGPHAGSGSGYGSLEPTGRAVPTCPSSSASLQSPCGLLCLGDIFVRPLMQALPPPLSPAHLSARTALAALGVVLSLHMCHPFRQTNWGRSPHYTAEAAGPGMNKPLTPGSQPGVMEWGLDPGPLLTSQPPALGAPDWESQHPDASHNLVSELVFFHSMGSPSPQIPST